MGEQSFHWARDLSMLCPKCQKVYDFSMVCSYTDAKERLIHPMLRYVCPDCKIETYHADRLLVPTLQKLNAKHFHTMWSCSVCHPETPWEDETINDLAQVYLSEEISNIVSGCISEEKWWWIGPHILMTGVDADVTSYLYKVLINQTLGEDLLIADYKLWREGEGWLHKYKGKLPVIFESDSFELFVAVREADEATMRKANELLADVIDKWLAALEEAGVEHEDDSDPEGWVGENGSLSNYAWY